MIISKRIRLKTKRGHIMLKVNEMMTSAKSIKDAEKQFIKFAKERGIKYISGSVRFLKKTLSGKRIYGGELE